MASIRCLGCMSLTDRQPCSHCGYDGSGQPGSALWPGTVLKDRYLVGRVLAQGRCEINYIGWDTILERKVAVKEYYPSSQVRRSEQTGIRLQWNENAAARALRGDGMTAFLEEARKLSQLEAVPEATRVYDSFRENETAYLILEYVSGHSLQELIARKGPLTWNQAAPIFTAVISAMEKYHQAEIGRASCRERV